MRAGQAKNRKRVTLPLPRLTTKLLVTWMANRNGAEVVFDEIPPMDEFREDLMQAGIAYETAEGVVDFHALRVTYATSLERAGASLARAQKLLWHSDPKLTANVYTKTSTRKAQEAVARLNLPEGL